MGSMAHPETHENGILSPWLAMDEGRFFCDALSSRSSLTWPLLRTHDCCRLYGVEHAEQIVSFFSGLHHSPIGGNDYGKGDGSDLSLLRWI
jgi:hypothetical protein